MIALLVVLLSPTGWDPGKAVDLKTLKSQRVFAQRATALCPTQAQAKARECGNSVEFPEKGEIVRPGEIVTVVGDAPEGDYWKAIRFQKAGTLPSWILASDVGPKPKLHALDAFDKKTRKGTVWRRLKTVRVGAFDDARYLLFAEVEGKPVALRWATSESPRYAIHHQCLIYGDCLALAYVCDKDYCDEVSVEVRPTKETVAAPADPEGEWPKGWAKAAIPVFEVVELADRFGTFGPK